MSVFDDFQRMWMQKFPHSTLSDEWEHDVRASLQQHRDKITDLTKELEQETLYCEYLEQLLSDVEKLRSNDITTKNNGVNGGGVDSDSNKLGNLLNNDKNSQHQQQTTTTSANKTEVHKNGSGGGGGGGGGGENNVKNSSENVANNDKDNDENINNLIQLRRNGALNQCINELSTNLRRCISEVPSESNDHHKNSLETEDALKASRSRCNSLNEKQSPAKSPSHFITVIEVKEDNVASSNNNGAAVKKTNSKVSELRKCIENYEKGDEPTPKASELLASIQENKRKIPPRPPPKFVRRTGAAVDPPVVPRKPDDRTPDSSLERNVKPSDILRQKSNESLESSRSGGGGNKSHFENLSKAKSTELVEEFERRLIKSESLEKDKIKKSDSPTGSLGKISNDNLSNRSRGGASSATGSLDKAPYKGSDSLRTTDSKESLISDGATSDKIQKSYESVSSLGIDGLRNVEDVLEGEPYYDTVPTENNDETLPMPATRVHKNSGSQIDSESPGRHSNYVNIDYFLAHTNEANRESMDSDPEDGGVPPMLMRHISHDEYPSTPGQFRKLPTQQSENRNTIIRHIISSIITSEQLYVQCLNKMVKYMKAINATLTTSQPVITKDEYQTIFFKIEDLYNVHNDFLIELVAQKEKSTLGGGDICVGGAFKTLAEHNHLYGAYLHNYGRAIDTVKKCGANNAQFKEIVSNIKLDSQNEASLSLEDLLHKPVARVQKNALVLQDLLNETPEDHFDYPALKEAQKIMRNFLSEFNFIHTKSIYPSEDKSLRRLIKNSFIVELADGHRKLRHLFLFNDVIACAKYKASGRDRFEFELKWFIPVKDIMFEDSIVEIKESNPWNILQLKSQACTVRDQIMLEEKDDKKTKFNGSSRVGDKHRKKLADLEGQLVLASPNLVFKLKNSATGKILTFFLSSDFEKSQWIESIESLKESCNLPGQNIVSIYELQAWIAACQNLIKTEMGSYLLRNNRDESLFVGDLHLTIQGLQSFDHPVDSFICIEVDSYGHYFRKAKTKLICRNSSPIWNESFVIELEGSQNLRILLYEDQPKLPALKAKSVLKLSRQWLTETSMNRTVNLTDKIQLSLILKFIPGEKTLRRVPTSKPGALFGAKMPQVLKREKRDTPFIISACIREVERRGMCEVGIYRVSGSASDLARLKKSFETNSYEAEQLLKEVDIHSVTGILKSYLRELPEALFTDSHYQYFFETFNKYSGSSEAARNEQLQAVFSKLPLSNQKTINMILDHLVRVHQQEVENKMSLHNLAMVFGPTLLRPGPQAVKQKDLLESSTVDVMAQAGILYCFLQARLLSKH